MYSNPWILFFFYAVNRIRKKQHIGFLHIKIDLLFLVSKQIRIYISSAGTYLVQTLFFFYYQSWYGIIVESSAVNKNFVRLFFFLWIKSCICLHKWMKRLLKGDKVKSETGLFYFSFQKEEEGKKKTVNFFFFFLVERVCTICAVDL